MKITKVRSHIIYLNVLIKKNKKFIKKNLLIVLIYSNLIIIKIQTLI